MCCCSTANCVYIWQVLFTTSQYIGHIGVHTGQKPHAFTVSMNERGKCLCFYVCSPHFIIWHYKMSVLYEVIEHFN